MIRPLSWCLSLLLLAGCQMTPSVRIAIQPDVPKINDAVPILLKGKITYDGKEEYFPRTIRPIDTRQDGLAVRYVYEDVHQLARYYDPPESETLSFVRRYLDPTYAKEITVLGRVTVFEGGNVLKVYEAVAYLSTPTRGGQTLTELRRLGLLAVRDSIEGQMYQDREYLRKLQE